MYNQIHESIVTGGGGDLLAAQESRHRKQKFLRNFLRLIIQQLFIAINQPGLLVTMEDKSC